MMKDQDELVHIEDRAGNEVSPIQGQPLEKKETAKFSTNENFEDFLAVATSSQGINDRHIRSSGAWYDH